MRKETTLPARRLALSAFCLLLPCASAAAQTGDDLRSDHPDRYVVQQGDTLWDIANKFLKEPWQWPSSLQRQENETGGNPAPLFPGDLLVVTSDRRIKTVRVKPRVRAHPLDRAIPTIPPHIIEPFLNASLIVKPGEMEKFGHVVGGVDDELVMGKYNDFYARGLEDIRAQKYRIFRAGQPLRHPQTGELLGIEGIHVGEAEMVRWADDTARLRISNSEQEVVPGDRLVPMEDEPPLPYYQPRAPAPDLTGWIIYAPRGVKEAGKYDIVIVTGGRADGIEEGHVLKAIFHRGARVDPVTGEQYQVPDEASGLLMVINVFDRVSYALIIQSNRQIALGDAWEAP